MTIKHGKQQQSNSREYSTKNLTSTTEQISNQCFLSKSARMQKRQDRLSSTNSPHKLGMVGLKHQRTIAVKNLTKSLHETIAVQHLLILSTLHR